MEHGPHLNCLRSPVALQYLPSTAHHGPDLHGYRQCIRLAIGSMPCVFASGTRVIGPFELRVVDVKAVVCIYRRAIELAIDGCPEIDSHLVCCAGYDALESRTDLPPLKIGRCVEMMSTQKALKDCRDVHATKKSGVVCLFCGS